MELCASKETGKGEGHGLRTDMDNEFTKPEGKVCLFNEVKH